jgi:hypothetical protein
MLRETIVAASLVVLLIFAPIGQGASVPEPWKVIFTEATVALGSPILVTVEGPARGWFETNVTEAPFNHSYPIVSFGSVLPNSTIGGGIAVVNLTIPTIPFTLGEYQIVISAPSDPSNTTILSTTFEVVNNVNITLLEAEYAEMLQNWTNANDILGNLRTDLAQQEVWTQFLEFSVLAETILFVFVMSITRTGLGETEYGRRIRRFFGGLIRGTPFREFDAWGIDRENPTKNPLRIYRSWYCRSCRVIDRTKEEIERHLQSKCSNIRIEKPLLNVHYAISTDAVRKRTADLTTPRPYDAKAGRLARARSSVDLRSEI